jgi:hypothetical protein
MYHIFGLEGTFKSCTSAARLSSGFMFWNSGVAVLDVEKEEKEICSGVFTRAMAY